MSLSRMLENWSRLNQRDYYKDEPIMWGMSIDLNKCTGCASCVTACNAENNIPAVGKEKCGSGHTMSWMRIERYWDLPEGEADLAVEDSEYPERGAHFAPMMCQQCNHAPCEPVCPVAATYHNPDGLNAQVYNRCIGSRYCGTNCPFKVRYFNFFDYQEDIPHPMEMLLNPDVTVRSKGVMEKCTFCVQRLRNAKGDQADKGIRGHVEDGAVQTACQQSCPTDAIVFGNLKDETSKISHAWESHGVELNRHEQFNAEGERGYRVFEELNVEPSVMYLDRVRDTNA